MLLTINHTTNYEYNDNLLGLIQTTKLTPSYRKRYRNIGKHYKNIKISPTTTVSVCYYISYLTSGLQVWSDF